MAVVAERVEGGRMSLGGFVNFRRDKMKSSNFSLSLFGLGRSDLSW